MDDKYQEALKAMEAIRNSFANLTASSEMLHGHYNAALQAVIALIQSHQNPQQANKALTERMEIGQVIELFGPMSDTALRAFEKMKEAILDESQKTLKDGG